MLSYEKRYKIIVSSATDMRDRLLYSSVYDFSGTYNKGLLSVCDCLLSPCWIGHSGHCNHKQQVAKTSIF
jgi:hypothetical protein